MSPYFTIDCKDVFLREYRNEDLDELHALTMQPEIHTFLPGWNVSKEQRADWLANYEIPGNHAFLEQAKEGLPVGDLRLRLGIVHKESGAFIGWCCTGPKDGLPEPNREVMYAISKDHRGKGYTSQAVGGLTNYLFEHAGVEALNAIALPYNIGSIKVIQRCGFVYRGQIEIENDTYEHYTLNKR
ncbi:GNAT family N-acetyltransferase [Paenibacillus harenae]|uniref:GNAT family N-acetyltransferase n=1 Tax=Paenibacillus harenae TaxID=306543 RepID=UPI00278EACAC|nr:GNAT family N-acetyltransferase [Paenibacillus harenae]MDQ0062838.1 RimJ/RimL family protein N-acetyltransferase [Paenibacillus harenae]